ncbi:MAG: glutamate-1-semialdehyde 2,1-aminomutase [Clostridium sp.]|jgi:glutamate-1-semialdehyde 2,1-aminomutase|uniref:glutamate-1-semialdehyde 2,1-aminomutase n=1 Tax=Clostridium sp. TaxID=1506 RepID=UPI0025C0955C|nr:glutamate-1-semialdehyde 2,1-aminomutase [Clostridium sp.]MCH3964411.1 glutamate-1-semialdehyde 2,1-aminomutase [Clostridium sp.]MCI1715586.1 glutamate-1-semialdehyde 2,1-aminomutase [Clostridium sp.]MCI1799622.1 glutamate-1-semialdehyde 2,1-aminomutase [Clostridium sp.]MCI1813770.1 glutamate-1-semialdehyde 2,1-aminomutase [Clostridium sp.]MCI1870435.1 glutamate-1-semialdehyde 2,1-aminomutase [Clostridium sp.]
MKSNDIFKESEIYMPGGVNSPVRAFRDVPLDPPVIKRGKEAHIYDEDGNEYIDFVCAWGPMILGHCDDYVVDAVKRTGEEAISFGAPTKIELELAKYICTTVDNVEMIRMVNSGTEATMSAVKLARGYTGRDRIIKFAGCYHGHYDDFLVDAGSGLMTAGTPGSAGVTEDSVKNTIIAEYNNIKSVEKIFEKYGDIAAVIVEPVAGNMGVIPGNRDFLEGLRKLCDENGSLLIFDEVMSGFRVAYKGAQSIYGIKPDITTFAKIMGGGLPCGAYGGKRKIMEKLSPMGPVYQAGTMSGNPIVMAAGLATLKKLHENPGYYEYLEKLGQKLQSGIEDAAKRKNLPVVVNRCGSMFTVFFTEDEEVRNYEDAKRCNTGLFAKYFKHMLENGIYIAPSQFESVFLNVKHSESDIDEFLNAFETFEI